MRVGVISDTHLRGYDEGLKRIVDEHFRDADLIVHAGDLVDIRVLDVFGTKEVKAVWGNMDPPSVRRALPASITMQISGFTVGVAHGWGPPTGLEERLLRLFGPIHCLIFGHSHEPVNCVRNGVLLFNPGSAVDGRFSSRNSMGILEISDTIEGGIITL